MSSRESRDGDALAGLEQDDGDLAANVRVKVEEPLEQKLKEGF